MIAYKKVGWFRDIVNRPGSVLKVGAVFIFDLFKKNWPYLLGIIGGPFVLAGVVIYKHFDLIKKWAREAVDAIKSVFDGLVSYIEKIPHKIGKVFNKIPGFKQASHALGWVGSKLAGGGLVTRAGGFMVGERGPEIVSLPTGPPSHRCRRTRGRRSGSAVLAAGSLEVVVPVYLDGEQVARSVAKVTADKLARRRDGRRSSSVWSGSARTTRPITLTAKLSGTRPNVDAGYGGWQEVARPRRSPLSIWTGAPAFRVSCLCCSTGGRPATRSRTRSRSSSGSRRRRHRTGSRPG